MLSRWIELWKISKKHNIDWILETVLKKYQMMFLLVFRQCITSTKQKLSCIFAVCYLHNLVFDRANFFCQYIAVSSWRDISYAGPDILGFGKDDDGISNNIFNLLDDLEKAVKQEPFDTTATGNLDTNHFHAIFVIKISSIISFLDFIYINTIIL